MNPVEVWRSNNRHSQNENFLYLLLLLVEFVLQLFYLHLVLFGGLRGGLQLAYQLLYPGVPLVRLAAFLLLVDLILEVLGCFVIL